MNDFFVNYAPNPYWENLPNVWLGATVENRKSINRIDHLRNINAKIRYLSVKPLLEDLGEINLDNIHWVIVGGESGPKARPMHPDWVRSIRDQCQAAGVPYFHKQNGEWLDVDTAIERGFINTYTDTHKLTRFDNLDKPFVRVGKKKAGRLLDGREWNEWPS